MFLQGVYSRMHDSKRWKPFRNRAQIEVSEDCVIYSTRPMAGETKRTELPIQWQGDTRFSVNWSPVCRHWGKAAIFRAHVEHGVQGLEEQAQHFWRYEGPAAQNVQDNQRSHQARTPKSGPTPPRPTGASPTDAGVPPAKTAAVPSPSTPLRPRDASTTDVCVPTAKTAAVPSASLDPKSYKTCIVDFDPQEYGSEYLRLTKGVKIKDLDPPESCEGWAYGSLVFIDGGLSPPGWYPPSHAQ